MVDAAAPPLEKPLPVPIANRPGTSGTELNLRTNREKAQTSFRRAHRAEQAYRAKRQANNARRDVEAAKAYYKEGFHQLRLGAACSVRAVKAIPAVLRDRREHSRAKSDVKKRERVAEEKKKWEEKARASEDAMAEGQAAAAAAAAVK